jgi:phosphomannomutase
MTLIRSISGIRGTIGGKPSEGLTPDDIVMFSGAFAELIKRKTGKRKVKIVLGFDARISGPMVKHLVTGTLMACGVDVMEVGLSTTPTVEMAVSDLTADGGIILTASHNPEQWNAMKLLNSNGEFLSAKDGEDLLQIAENKQINYPDAYNLGTHVQVTGQLEKHIQAILDLPLVDIQAIKERNLKVGIDAINSSGGIALPALLERMGVTSVVGINLEPNGHFSHNPEPIPEHLGEICQLVRRNKLDVGFVVDPDVDRLAIIMENGEPFGEEYTLVAVADYILQHNPGNTVSNLSSTQALRVVTENYSGKYFATAVGEVNVVEKMKKVAAVIGGEGNGGVIYPDLHYGRDALVGIALFLSWLAGSGMSCSALRRQYPDYFISKNKIQLKPGMNPDQVIETIAYQYAGHTLNREDGLRIDFGTEWVHLRKSNTEPIIRIYAESASKDEADALTDKVMEQMLKAGC